ncbi:MAG: sensor histidine kinase, partial [Bacteroidota bacterium]
RLIQSQEQERQRIANELHDSLGQTLLVIKNRMLMMLQARPGEKELDETSGLVSQTIEEVRNISHNLRPHQLDQLGVTKTIRALVKQVAESSPIQFSVDVEEIDDILVGDEDIGLFRIIQESLSNIVKHSGAASGRVSIKRAVAGIEVTITDDGKGMDVTHERLREELGKGFGLSGMEERAKMFGWKMEVRSQLNNGTEVRVEIGRSKNMDEG